MNKLNTSKDCKKARLANYTKSNSAFIPNTLADKNGISTASNLELSDRLGKSKSTINKCLVSLRENGFIKTKFTIDEMRGITTREIILSKGLI